MEDISDISSPAGRKPSPAKPKPNSAEILAEVPRKDTYGPDHGSGNPHLQPGELQNSETWKSHKSHGTVKPKKKQA